MNKPTPMRVCPHCGELMHLEAPIWGGADEWVCLACDGPAMPDPPPREAA